MEPADDRPGFPESREEHKPPPPPTPPPLPPSGSIESSKAAYITHKGDSIEKNAQPVAITADFLQAQAAALVHVERPPETTLHEHSSSNSLLDDSFLQKELTQSALVRRPLFYGIKLCL